VVVAIRVEAERRDRPVRPAAVLVFAARLVGSTEP
jgi:hypothetical protein